MFRSVLVGGDARTVDVTVTLEGDGAPRGISLIVTPIDESATLAVERSSIVVSVWHESAAVVRGTVRHQASGAVAYFQGTDALVRIAEALNLRLEIAARQTGEV